MGCFWSSSKPFCRTLIKVFVKVTVGAIIGTVMGALKFGGVGAMTGAILGGLDAAICGIFFQIFPQNVQAKRFNYALFFKINLKVLMLMTL